MSPFVDYRYTDEDAAAPRTWTLLQHQLHTLAPLPGPAAAKPSSAASAAAPAPVPLPPPPPAPPAHDLIEVPATPAQFFQEAMAGGYGEFADYLLFWLLQGKTLTAGQVDDLRRCAQARVNALLRAFRPEPATATAPFHLVPRDIYPLIESSEKALTSYHLGCAMAAVCAGPVLGVRQPGTNLGYLFHARLMSSVDTAVTPTQVRSASRQVVDFLAYDDQWHAHLFEAKGSADGFPYGLLADGIDQCRTVRQVLSTGLAPQPPASLNVVVAFLARQKVAVGTGKHLGQSVRVAVVQVQPSQPAPVVQAPQPAPRPSLLEELVGRQAVGLHGLLRTATQSAIDQGWRLCQLTPELGFAWPLRLALPAAMDQAIAAAVERIADDAEVWRRMRSLAQALPPKGPAARETVPALDISHRLQDLGRQLIDLAAQPPEQAPEGFSPSASVPWLLVK